MVMTLSRYKVRVRSPIKISASQNKKRSVIDIRNTNDDPTNDRENESTARYPLGSSDTAAFGFVAGFQIQASNNVADQIPLQSSAEPHISCLLVETRPRETRTVEAVGD